MDNANPTVLNASELPTRRGKSQVASKSKADEITELLKPRLNPAMQMYQDSEESASDSEEEAEEEPIDEQEIYGKRS